MNPRIKLYPNGEPPKSLLGDIPVTPKVIEVVVSPPEVKTDLKPNKERATLFGKD